MSYNAAGVLAHIASDGPDDWTIDEPKREDVLDRMSKAIKGWDLNSERNINYRSFEPILGLLKCFETSECQLWAVVSSRISIFIVNRLQSLSVPKY